MINTSSARPAVQIADVTFCWPGQTAFELTVPNFELHNGERVLLLGESGAGKSTFLNLICGVVTPDQGSIKVDGNVLKTLSARQRDRFRAENIGIIFQQFNLLPYASPLDNVLLPLCFAPSRARRVPNARATALTLAENLGIPTQKMLFTKAGQLSVGQQQRVAIARALIGSPPLILADEPTSALDAGSQSDFLKILFTQCTKAGASLLMVSHDARLGKMFDRVVHMSEIAKITESTAP